MSYPEVEELFGGYEKCCTPELHLWATVVHHAVLDIRAQFPSRVESTTRWLRSPSNGPGSFRWVCSLFDVDPERAAKHALSIAAMPKLPWARGIGAKAPLSTHKEEFA